MRSAVTRKQRWTNDEQVCPHCRATAKAGLMSVLMAPAGEAEAVGSVMRRRVECLFCKRSWIQVEHGAFD